MMVFVPVLPPPDAAKANAHPLRVAILERLYDGEASPVQLAKELRHPAVYEQLRIWLTPAEPLRRGRLLRVRN